MEKNQKVVWSEGMFLTPHHFQQWDRYQEKFLSERLGILRPYGWGCTDIDIDVDGLANGTFSLLRLRGVLQDGLMVKIPDEDHSPPTRSLGDFFSPEMDHLDVYLGIAIEHPGRANCAMDDHSEKRQTRYQLEYRKVSDSNTGENVREVSVARKNWRIFFQGEMMEDYVTLKLAELIRTPGGTIALRESYIPPCMRISASPYLMRLVRGLLELLIGKSRALAGSQAGGIESGTGNSMKLSLLHTVNASIPILSHTCNKGLVPPEDLYLMLSRLGGELTTFSAAVQARDLPPYDHSGLSRTFVELEEKIRALLEGVTPTEVVEIPLELIRENVRSCEITDERLLESYHFYLVVSGDLPDDQICELIPRRIRVSAAQDLDLIVSTAMPGVRLYHAPHPPTSLSARNDHHYFRLESEGDYWRSICRSRSVSFYIPADLQGLRFELLATKA